MIENLFTDSSNGLAFPLTLCYTLNRNKAHQNQGLSGLPPIPGGTQIPAVPESRGIRQMDIQVCPHGSLLRGKCAECSRPSTRKTKLKENFI